MKIITWNVNSIRARLDRCRAYLEQQQPDVLCLQEVKVVDEDFPHEAFAGLSYHIETFGQRTYNGVAILSREAPCDIVRGIPDGEDDPQARLLAATIGGVRIINVYVPNGAEVNSDKFAYKLRWLQRLRAWLDQSASPESPLLICGDFNIAPEDRDVYDPESFRGRVHFHPEEHALLRKLCEFGVVDAFRLHHEEGGLYSWWDYRAGMFRRNRGLRIDLIYVTPPLVDRCTSVEIDRETRKGSKPSDHAPVVLQLSEPPP
jgi:exodeoxyribonuclease-3